MTEQGNINSMIDSLPKATAFKTVKTEVDGKTVVTYEDGDKTYRATEVLSMTIHNEVAVAASIADKGFTLRWVKAELDSDTRRTIKLIAGKDAGIRLILASLDIKRRCENAMKNAGITMDEGTVEQVQEQVSKNILEGTDLLRKAKTSKTVSVSL